MGQHQFQSIEEVLQEIIRIHQSLPLRPSIEEIDAAFAVVRHVDEEERAHLGSISNQKKGFGVSEGLYFVLQEMQKNLVFYQCKDQKREALKLLDLENVHVLFDELVQRASRCLPSSSNGTNASTSMVSSKVTGTTSGTGINPSIQGARSTVYSGKEVRRSTERLTRDDSYVKKAKSTLYYDGSSVGLTAPCRSTTNSTIKHLSTAGEYSEKLSLIKLSSVIEVSSKKRSQDLNLQNKLMDQVERLPDSIGKLSGLVSLNLSENHITVLPKAIGNLSSLRKLDLHSNWITELPESIGDLLSLMYLNLRGNQLTSMPSTFGRLVHLTELDLSSNWLSSISDDVGNLRLKKLIVETNNLGELPYTIGHCNSLVELRADYNHLKCLPEAVGRLEHLEVLSVRYNKIKSLPITVASLSSLREINLSFNVLESVPESLCLATTLVKMNIGNNFADLHSLPHSIGNLGMLEELDISNNQIRALPDSFGMLSQLRVLHVEENPLEVPPRHIAKMGAQAVVQYMAVLVARRDIRSQPAKTRKSWAALFSLKKQRKET